MRKIIYILSVLLLLSNLLYAEEKSTESPEQIYSKGLMFKQSRKYKEAISEFMKLEDFNKEKHKIYYQISDCYFNLKDPVKAADYAEKAISYKEDYEDAYYILVNSNYILRRYQAAADASEEILFFYPDRIQYHYLASYIYYANLKNYPLVIHHLEEVLRYASVQPVKNDFKERAHLMLAESYYNTGDYDECLKHLDHASSYNSINNLRLLNITNNFLEKYLYKEAIVSFNIFFKYGKVKNPPNYNALYGRLLYLKNDHRAMTFLRKGIADKGYSGLLSKGLFYERIGKYEEAEKILTDVISKNSAITTAHVALARIYEKSEPEKAYNHYLAAALDLKKTNLYSASIQLLNSALEIRKDAPVLHYYLSELYEKQGNYSMAILHMKKAYPNTKKITSLLHLSYLHHMNNDNKSSEKYILIAEKENPDNSRIFFWRGVMDLDNKKYDSSISNLNKSLELEATDSSYFYLAVNYDKVSKLGKAISSLEKAVELNSKNEEYQNYLAYLYARNGSQLDKAEMLVKDALKKQPNNGAYLDSLGWVYYKQGKYDESKKILLRAKYNLKAEKNMDAEVYDHLGDVYIKLNNKKRALYYWKESVKLEKNEHIEKKISKMSK